MPAPAAHRLAILHRDADRAEQLARVLRHAGHRVDAVPDQPLPGVVDALCGVSPDLVLALSPLENPLSVTMAVLRDRLQREVAVLGLLRRPEDADRLGRLDDEADEPIVPAALVRRVRRLLEAGDGRVRMERQVRTLTGLNRLAWASSLAGGPEPLFAELARECARMLGARKAVVLLFDPGRREMAAAPPGHGLHPDVLRALRYPVDGEARARWNFRLNGSLSSNEARSDGRLMPDLVAALDVSALLLAPVCRGRQVLGALLAADRPGRPFHEDDLELLEAAAHQASVAVENLRLHDELRRANDRLQEVDRLKSDFVAMVAHDIRNPLMAIRSFAELLLEGEQLAPEERLRFVRTILAQSDDLARLASDAFLVTQVESASLEYRFAALQAEPFLRDAVERFGTGREVFEVEVPAGVPPLRGDPERLRQVLANLLSNAMKYSPPGSPVRIRCGAHDGGMALVQVADRGLGIPADQIGRLFHKFARVRTTEHLKVAGSGLGLYICRLIVEGHGGRIWADSEPGAGTTVSVLLPLASEEARPPQPATMPGCGSVPA